MTTTRAHARALACLGSLALLLVTAGCGSDDATEQAGDRERQRPRAEAPRSPDEPTPSAAPSASPSAAPEASTRPSGRRTVARPTPPRPRGNALTITSSGPDRHLVDAGALGSSWSVASTHDERQRAFSRCHRATMSDVGAQLTRVRDFAGPGSAAQAVSRFADGKTAWRVEQVVLAWADDCADDLRSRDAALGVVRHGSWVSVVEVAGVRRPGEQVRRALAAVDATF